MKLVVRLLISISLLSTKGLMSEFVGVHELSRFVWALCHLDTLVFFWGGGKCIPVIYFDELLSKISGKLSGWKCVAVISHE